VTTAPAGGHSEFGYDQGNVLVMSFQIFQITQVAIGSHGVGLITVVRLMNHKIRIVGVGMISNKKTPRRFGCFQVGKVDLLQVFGTIYIL